MTWSVVGVTIPSIILPLHGECHASCVVVGGGGGGAEILLQIQDKSNLQDTFSLKTQ